eukprot:TRINITY_DN984_c0_g1_i2.p1 TRINITY_DN984_c0_g1~~TRINITY_DN984_c0_g1_i2.p1  ORF type:complete len:217 (+),score=42.22 TRINITY_DN984_c0_g1_i2:78-728(+)
MTPEVRWFVVMLFALIGFLCAQFAPLDPALKSRLDSASRTAFATVLLRNGPTVAAVHGYGQASAIFSTWLGIGYLGAGLVPLGMDEDEIPIVAVYLTVLNISMTCWCFGLLMGIAKLGLGSGKGQRAVLLLRLGALTVRGMLFVGLLLTQWWLSTIHPPSKSLKVVMVLLQFVAVGTTFIETHTLSDNLTRHALPGAKPEETDLMMDISLESSQML